MLHRFNFVNLSKGRYQGAFNDSSLGYVNYVGTDSGTANLYNVTLPFGVPSSYNIGMCVAFKPAHVPEDGSNPLIQPPSQFAWIPRATLRYPEDSLLGNPIQLA
jgi:hypothetical protein